MTASASFQERRWLPRFLAVGALRIPYVSRAKAIESIDSAFRDRRRLDVTFCNAHTMTLAFDSAVYSEQLGRFLVLNDGVGIDLLSRLFGGGQFADNLNGTDFVPDLLAHTGHQLRIYLLGGQPGVAEVAALEIARRFPQHVVVGTHHGFLDGLDVPALLDDINGLRPDLLLIGMGNPRQETFVATWGRRLDVPVTIGVGALLDFIAGRVPRAPGWMRRLRAEWLFRLSLEPQRLGRRYTVEVGQFLAEALRQRILPRRGKTDPSSIAIVEGSPSEMRLLPQQVDTDQHRTAA